MVEMYLSAFAAIIITGTVLKIVEILFREAKENRVKNALAVFTMMFFGNVGKDVYLKLHSQYSMGEIYAIIDLTVAMIVFTLWYICLMLDCNADKEDKSKNKEREERYK